MRTTLIALGLVLAAGSARADESGSMTSAVDPMKKAAMVHALVKTGMAHIELRPSKEPGGSRLVVHVGDKGPSGGAPPPADNNRWNQYSIDAKGTAQVGTNLTLPAHQPMLIHFTDGVSRLDNRKAYRRNQVALRRLREGAVKAPLQIVHLR